MGEVRWGPVPFDFVFPLRRLFLALPINEGAKIRFGQIQDRLGLFSDLFRFQNPSSPHLTIHFFGDVGELEYQGIVKHVEGMAARNMPFPCSVRAAGTFGKPGSERVLFLELGYSAELSKLAKQCPWPRDHPFSAHITVARMKNPHAFTVQKKKVMKILKDVSFPITFDRFRLYAEVDGVKQTPVGDFVFGSRE
jgi:2'-5' RNA ligase